MVDQPVTLKEHVVPSMNTTRQDYINDKNRKYGGSTKFSFRKYKTDRERLEEYLKEKEENQKYIDRIKNAAEEKNVTTSTKYHSIQQPSMRYKPRTDLERIYYSVNDYSFGKISKDIIDEQLSKLHLNDLKKDEEDEMKENRFLEKYKNMDEKVLEDLEAQKEFYNRQGYNEKNSETVKQIVMILNTCQRQKNNNLLINGLNNYHNKDDDQNNKLKNKLALKNQINSIAAKKMMGEYNTKTFFKAASVYSLNLDVAQKIKDKTNFINNKNLNFFQENYKNSNKKINKNNAKNITNSNTDSKFIGCLSSRNNVKKYLNFYEMDEPYYDERKIDNDNSSCYYHSNTLQSLQNLSVKKNKSSMNFSNYGNLLSSTESRNDRNILNTFESISNNELNYLKTNVDFKIGIRKTEEIYNQDALLYLQKISASNTLTTEQNNEEENFDKKHSDCNSDLMNKQNFERIHKFGVVNNLNKNNDIRDSSNEYLNLRKNINFHNLDDTRKYDEERIFIDNESFLKSQINLISKKILKKCNFLQNKSDFNNKEIKSGQGKLMITSGMTINDFTKKFNVPK